MMLTTQNLIGFLKASRPINLLISFLTFSVAAYFSFLYSFQFLYEPLFWLQASSILIIAAAGYLVNDLYDYKIDLINKPHKTYVNIYASAKKFWTLYFLLNLIAFFLSFQLPFKFFFINLLSIFLLFTYAYYFKRYAIIGNLIISTLAALVIISGGLLKHIKLPLMWMTIFAFLITLIREIVKDVEDINGDLQNQLKTLPILAGLRLTQFIIIALVAVLMLSIPLPFIFHYLLFREFLWSYLASGILLVILPLLYVLKILMYHGFHIRKYSKVSALLKAVMLGGIFSCFFLK